MGLLIYVVACTHTKVSGCPSNNFMSIIIVYASFVDIVMLINILNVVMSTVEGYVTL